MAILIFLILTEIFTFNVLRQHFIPISRTVYYVSVLINIVLSIWVWVLYFTLTGYPGFFDTPEHVWMLMAFTGALCAVVIPRLLLITLHYTGRLLRRTEKGQIRWLTGTGITIYVLCLIVIITGAFYGKFNFRYEKVTVSIPDLHDDLDNFRIVHISDLHLAGFYHHSHVLPSVMSRINEYSPDIIINTGDFITYGWREFGRNDTILVSARGRYGKFAVIGNHDAGTYHPDFTAADRDNHVLIMNNLIEASGYRLLNNESEVIRVGNAELAICGVTSAGRHPDILHGDLESALQGADSADLRILLTHDPNHWLEEVAGKKNNIELTLSGHTHGMQMGIMTRNFRWSPSRFFYPNWNGLYQRGTQFQYVNRGAGVLGIPFRIWMPPEITLITLTRQ